MSNAKQAVIDLGTQYEAELNKFREFRKALAGVAKGIPSLSIFASDGHEHIDLVFHGEKHRIVHYFVPGENKNVSLVRLEPVNADYASGLAVLHKNQFVFDQTGAVWLGGSGGTPGLSIPVDSHEVFYFLLSGIRPQS